MKNPISVKDIIDFHIIRLEDMLKDSIDFEDKSELNEWKMEIFTSVLSLKVLLEDYYR